MKNILMIDEMPDAMDFVIQVCEGWGFKDKYNFIITPSSLEAFFILRDKKIDLVIQNLVRKKTLNALETLKLMKSDERFRNIPTVLYTVYTDRDFYEENYPDLVKYYDQFDAILYKLIDVMKFKELIPELIGE